MTSDKRKKRSIGDTFLSVDRCKINILGYFCKLFSRILMLAPRIGCKGNHKITINYQ